MTIVELLSRLLVLVAGATPMLLVYLLGVRLLPPQPSGPAIFAFALIFIFCARVLEAAILSLWDD